MFRKFHVKKDERALLFWKGDFAEILGPGTHWRVDPLYRMTVEKFALANTRFEHRLADFLVKAEAELVAREFHVLELGPTEFRLLHFLMAHPERVHSRTNLLDQVWGDHVFVEERTVDVHIRRLRKALEPTGHDRLIETVRGSGYRLAAN